MKDKTAKDESEEGRTKIEAVADESINKMTVNKVQKEENTGKCERRPQEDEESSDEKKLNCLTEDIQKLNIGLDDGDRKQNIPPDSKEDGEYIQRGPTGGIAVETHGLMRDKNLPIGPTGNYVAPQMCFPQRQLQGNRRLMEEPEDQPQKYFRPPPFPCQQQFMQQQQPNFQPVFSSNGCNVINNLSQGPCPPQSFNFAPQSQGFQFGQQVITTDVRNTNNMSGGKVTVQSPIASGPNPFPVNIADDFLDEITDQQQHGIQTVSQGSILADVQLGTNNWDTNNFDPDYSKNSFKEFRRRSDPDSGVESEGGSPWSEQAPSPSSVYTSPASVESGIGQSPRHESQSNFGVSPPKYHGVTSPASYRATPSPANTSGYGSPGQPQLEDSNELINEELLEDAMNVIYADLQSTEESKKKQIQLTSQPPMMPSMIPASANMTQPALMNPQPQPQRLIRPPVMFPQQMPQSAGFVPVTTSGAPQQIIILPAPQQQNSSQPVILVPVPTSSAPPPKKSGPTQYKKILPKLSQPNPSTASSAGAGQTSVTMSNKGGNASNRNLQSQKAQEQQTKLLMLARRTVADIPRDDLSKQDDEGDTYLHIAVCKTDRYMVRALLERLHREKLDHLVDQENLKRQTPLYLAVCINQPFMVAMFIQFQADVNVLAQSFSSDGNTREVKAAIHVAASQGVDYHRTLQELLKAKHMQINIVNNYGQTALHCAILAHGKLKRNGQDRIDSVEIIRTLIKNGADPSAQDKKSGKTPLMYAIAEQRSTILVDTILTTVHPEKVKNVVKTQAFDGSSCLRIAEGLKGSFEVEIWNKLWNSLQSAANGTVARHYSLNQ